MCLEVKHYGKSDTYRKGVIHYGPSPDNDIHLYKTLQESDVRKMLSSRLMKCIEEVLGIRELNVVQRLAIPKILKGYNVLIISPTGTGKTEAALLPIFNLMITRGEGIGINAIYITPLRALNRDIFRRMERLAREIGIRIAVRHGDTAESIRRQQARNPPNILITTPETLQAILPGKILKYHLMHVKYVIIDEIHELVADKRGTQLFLALERLKKITKYDFQRIGLSATIGDVRYVAECLQGSSTRPIEVINAQMARRYEIEVDMPASNEEDENMSTQFNVPPEVMARLRRIREALSKVRSALIFTNTRDTAEALAFRLRSCFPELAILVHHGSLSKEERLEAEGKLKSGELQALVCTSSLELGIDIGSIDLVIQYASPRQATTLLQRVGRSGHRIGGIARGLIIALHPEEVLEAAVLTKMGLRGELEKVPRITALDVLAHQIIGILLDHDGKLGLKEIYSIVKGARPYRSLSVGEFLKVIDQLSKEGLVRVTDEGILSIRRGAWKYYYTNLSTIPDTISYEVEDIISRRKVGELDIEFIAKYGQEGLNFILGGRVWRIISIDHERRKILVEESENIEAAVPAWAGELIPVPFRCALEVASLRRRIAAYIQKGRRNPLMSYPLSKRALNSVIEYMREICSRRLPIPDDRNVLVELIRKKYLVIHVPLGSNGCYALGLLLSKLISELLNTTVAFRNDPYRVILTAGTVLSVKDIIKALDMLKDCDYEDKIKEAIAESMAFRWRLFNVAKRFGLLRSDTDFSVVSKRFIEMVRGSPVYEEAMNEVLRDKVDLEALKWFINRLRKGTIKVHTIEVNEPTPFSEPLIKMYFYDFISAKRPLSVIINLLRERISRTNVLLVCLTCLKWSSVRTIKTLPERPTCPNCGSRFIASVSTFDEKEAMSIIRKLRRREGLTRREKELLKQIQERARIVLLYGKKGVMTLAARGVGPKTAMKILREAKDEDDLMMKILNAERQYFRTRRFWD